ncbi:MAG: hydroxyisourate hydrolase [Candidatus Dormibacteraeota bacterium]|nr:hydroxyisourate hydrolase [Candidatus Dormibacteraeota bacterium]
MSGISTHVLDLTHGRGVGGLAVALERRGAGGEWVPLAVARTDDDGRVRELAPAAAVEAGVHRLVIDTGSHFAARGEATFFPEVVVVFSVIEPDEHVHVPVLLSPFGFTTYRGT